MQFIRKLIEFHKERKRASVDKFVVFLFPVLASAFSILLAEDYFTSIIFFFILPSVYLSFRYPLYVQKSLLYSLIFAGPIALAADYIAHVSFAWYIPHSIFDPFRLYGVVPVEEILFSISMVYFVVIFYEALLDHHIDNKFLKPHIKYLFIFETIIVGFFSLMLILYPRALVVEYFHLKLGLTIIAAPLIISLFRFPRLIIKFLTSGIYFFYFGITYELTALYMGYWEFPERGEFIGFVNILGFHFPIEEFVFWLILAGMAFIAYFEFFDDDGK